MKVLLIQLFTLLVSVDCFSQIYIDGTENDVRKTNPNIKITTTLNPSSGTKSLMWLDKRNNIIVVDVKDNNVIATYIIPEKERFIKELTFLTKDALRVSDKEWLYYLEEHAVRIRVMYQEFMKAQSIQFSLGSE